MGERSVYATHAHVFQIDPQTKKKWLPSSTQAVRVSYYYDPSRKTYRIITMENKEVLINSTITANMTFTKTSPKFGQWSDHRANTVFGLGFSSEKDLIQFQDKFQEAKSSAKELLEQRRRQKKEGGSSASNSSTISNADSTLSPTHTTNNGSTSSDVESEMPIAAPSTDNTPVQPKDEPQVVKELQPSTSTHTTPVSSLAPKKLTTDSPQLSNNKLNERLTEEAKHTNSTLDSQVESLKVENSKLKVALASSAQNVKKWETEMQTLRNNNAMLTTALEESTQHVAEWKRQLQKYKEDCDTLKKKVETMDTIERENEELKDVLSSVQVDLEQSNEELEAKSNELLESQKTMKTMVEEKKQCELRLKAVEEKSQRVVSASKEKLVSAQQTVQQLNNSLETIMRSCQTLSSQLHD